jgi:hypothetical protein
MAASPCRGVLQVPQVPPSSSTTAASTPPWPSSCWTDSRLRPCGTLAPGSPLACWRSCHILNTSLRQRWRHVSWQPFRFSVLTSQAAPVSMGSLYPRSSRYVAHAGDNWTQCSVLDRKHFLRAGGPCTMTSGRPPYCRALHLLGRSSWWITYRADGQPTCWLMILYTFETALHSLCQYYYVTHGPLSEVHLIYSERCSVSWLHSLTSSSGRRTDRLLFATVRSMATAILGLAVSKAAIRYSNGPEFDLRRRQWSH